VAVFIAIYGALGILWGCIWRDESRPRLTLYGALFGIVVYYALFHFVWRRANGLIVLYAPVRTIALAHVLWGMILAKSPKYARRIGDFSRKPAGQEEAVRSGEAIT
jgi:hypothetical protein